MSREPPSEGPASPSLDQKISRAIKSFDHAEAARLTTEGIALYPQDPKYPLARAAANVQLQKYSEAISDAREALALDPDNKLHRSLPYLNLGRALLCLSDFDVAFTMAEVGLRIDPGDLGLKECLELSRASGISKRAELGSRMGMDIVGDTFDGGEMWLKLERDEEARAYRHDPEFRRKVSEARDDNLKMGQHLREDKRLLKSLGILLNVRLRENIGGAEQEVEDDEEGNTVSWLDKLRREMISMIVDYEPPVSTKSCGSVEEAAEDEAEEAELVKELLKLSFVRASSIKEEEARES